MSNGILLLSGGRSSRMGENKAHLNFHGLTLLAWQIQRFEQKGFKVISGLDDRFSGFLGPLAGIDSALHNNELIAHWCVVPVDMPGLPVAAVTELFSVGQQTGKMVAYERCPLPLYLPAQSDIKKKIEEWLADENGQRSVYALHEQFDGRWLSHSRNNTELNNLNTPEQWQEFLREETKV